MQTWLNDHTSDAFVVCTSNDVEHTAGGLHPGRAVLSTLSVGLPGVAHGGRSGGSTVRNTPSIPGQLRPIDADFSGAEIKACCRLAALLDVSLIEAAQNVVPVARTAHESVEQLRQWASGRCLWADVPGIYTANGSQTPREASPQGSTRPVEQLICSGQKNGPVGAVTHHSYPLALPLNGHALPYFPRTHTSELPTRSFPSGWNLATSVEVDWLRHELEQDPETGAAPVSFLDYPDHEDADSFAFEYEFREDLKDRHLCGSTPRIRAPWNTSPIWSKSFSSDSTRINAGR